jgi:hypothetical protein
MSMIGYLLRVSQQELDAYLNDSSLLEEQIGDDKVDADKLIDIDKAWDGIVYLLTGGSIATADHPLLRVLFSGQLIDEDQDLGYGPAHYLTPEQVAVLNGELANITREDLEKKYNAEEMTALEVYPSIWEDDEETFTYLADNFESVKALYADAADNGEAVITFLS